MNVGQELIGLNAGVSAEEIRRIGTLLGPQDVYQENALRFAEAIVADLDKHSNALREYGEKALKWFGKGDGQYDIAASSFATSFPYWEICFENILVNQMFFSQFPFGMNVSAYCEYIGLCITYMLMRVLCLGNLVDEPSDEHLVDVCAALFRLVSHTDFGRTATAILSRLIASEMVDIHVVRSGMFL